MISLYQTDYISWLLSKCILRCIFEEKSQKSLKYFVYFSYFIYFPFIFQYLFQKQFIEKFRVLKLHARKFCRSICHTSNFEVFFGGGGLGVFPSLNTNKATWLSFCVIYRLRVTKAIGQKLEQMAMVRRRYRWSWDWLEI